MDSGTRALATDFTLAGTAMAVGAVGVGGGLLWNVGFAALAIAASVCGLFLVEQTPFVRVVDDHSPASLVAAFVVTLTVGLVLVVGWTVVASPVATLLFGTGVGLGVYRFVYGILRPVPEKRLTQETYPSEIDDIGQNDGPR